MLIPFLKMQAQGNDFIILDSFANPLPVLDFPAFARGVCKLHTGIGADGLVLLQASNISAAQMIIYNSDGSRAEMCGSALRCVSWLMHQKLGQTMLSIQTDSGLKQAEIAHRASGDIVSVNMGMPAIKEKNLSALGFTGDLVDVGNLHYVIWTESLNNNPHLLHGYSLEQHAGFPQAVNVQFACLSNPEEIELKIWERACGATLACGTGATASVFSGIKQGLLNNIVKVNMPGGFVTIEAGATGYVLSGAVQPTFSGDYPWIA